MSGVNKAIIVGRLGSDPEVKTVTSGQTVCRLSVATSENWTDRDGQKQERTEWHRVVVWGRMAEVCGQHLAKGRQVYLEGRLQTRSWEDQQGQKKYTTENRGNHCSVPWFQRQKPISKYGWRNGKPRFWSRTIFR